MCELGNMMSITHEATTVCMSAISGDAYVLSLDFIAFTLQL
jgi:hypothetical protein